MMRSPFAAFLAGLLAGACATSPQSGTTGSDPAVAESGMVLTPSLVVTTGGFTGPEAVRYDADQDVYFVSNFGSGSSSATDNNGFISRMRPDGALDQLRFIAGGSGGVTLHAPRGMTIVGDTLWVADADAVRGFHRRTGAPPLTASLAAFDVGFLNDASGGPDGVYVTDTGRNRIYRIAGGVATLALADSALGSPNGITWDAATRRFIIVPYGGASVIHGWIPGTTTLTEVGRSPGGRFDGVELLGGGLVLVASQADTSLHLFAAGMGRPIIRTGGRPADIAVDTRRSRVAVPFIALDRVEIWQLPRFR